MIIDKYKDAVGALNNPAYQNSRTELLVGPWETRDQKSYPILRDFHSSWLMYVDGERHKDLRTATIDVLKVTPRLNSTNVIQELDKHLDAGALTNDHACAVAKLWHRQFLGLTEDQQNNIFQLSDPILKFFFYDQAPNDDPALIEENIQSLTSLLETESFEDGRVLNGLITAQLPAGTCLNVIMDSYEPVHCALTTMFMSIPEINIPSSEAGDAVNELLRLYPPFRYINRYDTVKEKKLSIDLVAVNRDPAKFPSANEFTQRVNNRHLSFGFGKHACPGGKASFIILSDVLSHMLQKKTLHNFQVESGNINVEEGFSKTHNLRLLCPYFNKQPSP